MKDEPVRVLTIAGSDSGGAAGLQADLKTWTALGVYGMSVVTAATAQNSVQVAGIEYLPPDFVSAQLDSVLSDYGAQAIKTGFIGRAGLVESIARTLDEFGSQYLVVDPVLVNHQGQFMFSQELIHAYRDQLLPLAKIITPNWREALLLADLPQKQILDSMVLAKTMAQLHTYGSRNILITGHVAGSQMIDYWSDGKQIRPLAGPLIVTENVHGSGDTLSAAICAFLALGDTVGDAIVKARQYTAHALQSAASWRLGEGHGPLSHFD